MVKFFMAVAAIVATTGCSTMTKFAEPDRTSFYVQCINGLSNVTLCECVEIATVKATNITNPSTLSEEEFEPFRETLMSKVAECQKEAEQ